MPGIFLKFQQKIVDFNFITFKALKEATITKTKNARQAAGPVVDARLQEDLSSGRLDCSPEVFRRGKYGATDIDKACKLSHIMFI